MRLPWMPTNRTLIHTILAAAHAYIYPADRPTTRPSKAVFPAAILFALLSPAVPFTQAPTTRSKWSPRTHRGRSGILSPARISFIEVPISNARKTRKQDTLIACSDRTTGSDRLVQFRRDQPVTYTSGNPAKVYEYTAQYTSISLQTQENQKIRFGSIGYNN